MLILPKHSIDKKSTFLPVLTNAYAILKSDDFKNTIFKNTIFKIALIEIALPNGPLVQKIIDFSAFSLSKKTLTLHTHTLSLDFSSNQITENSVSASRSLSSLRTQKVFRVFEHLIEGQEMHAL
jgi:hypothetical protein